MNSGPSSSQRHAFDTVAVLARWLMGGLFVYMGLEKALDPVEFLKLVRQYEMVTHSWLLNSIAALLPWFEVFCGLLLLAGVAVRGAALLLLGMLVPFTLLVLKRALALQATQGIPFCAVEFDCGCGAGSVLICSKLLENCALIFLACWLQNGRGQKFCARYGLMKSR